MVTSREVIVPGREYSTEQLKRMSTSDLRGELESLVRAPEDVLQAGELIACMTRDKDLLYRLLCEYFSTVIADPARAPRESTRTYLSLLPAQDVSRPWSHNMSFGISVHEAGTSESIASVTTYTVLTPLNGLVEIQKFTIPEHWNPEIFDRSIKLIEGPTSVLAPGDVLCAGPGNEAYQFRFAARMAFLKIQSEPVVPFEWSFDAKTGIAWQSVSSVQLDTNAAHTCLRARALRDPQLAGALQTLLSHERHFVRWSAAQALGATSRECGLAALRALELDPHPHIALAANRALERTNTPS